MKKLFAYFAQGLLYIAPIVVTAYVIYRVFKFIDGLLKDLLIDMIGFHVPGLGLVAIFILLTILGYFGQSVLAQPFRYLFNRILKRAPLIKVIYSSLSDLFSAFVGKERKFQKPVKALINKENDLWKIGFITQDSLEEFGLLDKVAIYFPHSYNFSGELYIVPKANIELLDIPPAEAMKFVVSGGVTKVD